MSWLVELNASTGISAGRLSEAGMSDGESLFLVFSLRFSIWVTVSGIGTLGRRFDPGKINGF
jgi:hypothetical protein